MLFRKMSWLSGALVVASSFGLLVGGAASGNDGEANQCESACIASEDACYSTCEGADDASSCDQECQQSADLCLQSCE